MRFARFLSFLIVLLAPAPLAGQALHGTVLEDSTDAPIGDVTVVVSDPRGQPVAWAQTGTDGGFSIQLPTADQYSLRAERIGYLPATARDIALEAGDNLIVQVRMSGRAVVLPAVRVVSGARPPRRDGRLAGFDQRRRRERGRFLGPEQLGDTRGLLPTDVLLQRMPFIRVYGTESPTITLRTRFIIFKEAGQPRCAPTVYVDGHMYGATSAVSIDHLLPGDLAGVEVYESPNQAPGEFPPLANAYCGVIVLWSRG